MAPEDLAVVEVGLSAPLDEVDCLAGPSRDCLHICQMPRYSPVLR
jgi:hypothetical protein